MQVFLHHTIRNLLLAAMAFGATSCEWVKDDLPECPPTELRIGFKYDYHMFGGDVFYEHVGALYVYLSTGTTSSCPYTRRPIPRFWVNAVTRWFSMTWNRTATGWLP